MVLSPRPSLTSTYRLFLRALSASVLHHGPTKRSLRMIYRQPFVDAAVVEKKLASGIQDERTREELKKWMGEWHNRVDNTLELLYSSATNRGIGHRITRNLGLLTNNYLRETKEKQMVWNGQSPPKLKTKPRTTSNKSFDDIVFTALGETIRLAEGCSNVTLGRLPGPKEIRKHRKKTWREIVRNFSPAWYALIMGTGGVGALFHNYPYGGNSRIMNGFSLAFFFLNLILFLVFLLLSISSAVMYPETLHRIFNHPVYSLYVSCFPMGAVTLITVALSTVNVYWEFGGTPFVYVLWAFWWLDGILSFLCTFGLVFIMVTRHHHTLSSFSPLWFLPVVTLVVCSSTGQLIAAQLIKVSISHALLTMGVSVAMLFIGLTLAFMIMTVYVSRIIIEGFPTIDLIISSFIPLGPCGQGAYSFLIAGQNFQNTVSGGGLLASSSTGEVINVACLIAAFFVWCIGIWWLVMALVAIAHVKLKGHRIPFKLTFWGLVFPNAVQAIGTIQLSVALDAQIFRVLGAIYGAAVIALWVVLAIPTTKQVLDGSIFHAPYLEDDLREMAGTGVHASANGTMNGETKRI